MINFPRLRTACYAIGKRLQGYHLLQNPKGVTQNKVNMIKEVYDEVNSAGVRGTINRKIIRTTDELGNTNIEERNLMTNRIYDFDKKKFGKAVNKSLYVHRNNRELDVFESKNITFDQLNALPSRPWTKETNEMINKKNGLQAKTQSSKKNFFKVLYNNLTNKGENK